MALLIPGVGLVDASTTLLIPGAGLVEQFLAPTITTTALDPLQVGVAFSQQLAATGDEPITWSGTVPDGLTLSSTGLLSGTPTTGGAYSFTVTATNAGGSDDQLYTGTVEAAAVVAPTQVGGDDKVHPGWNRKRATIKRDREREFTEQIRDMYRALLGDPRTAERAEQIVASVTDPVKVKGESEAAHEAALMARAEAMRRRADAMDEAALQAEISLRFLHQELREIQEQDDFDAIEYLLPMVL